MTTKRSPFTAIQTQQAARILRVTRERLDLAGIAVSQASADLVALENIVLQAESATAPAAEKVGADIRVLSRDLLSKDPAQHAHAVESLRRVSSGLRDLGLASTKAAGDSRHA